MALAIERPQAPTLTSSMNGRDWGFATVMSAALDGNIGPEMAGMAEAGRTLRPGAPRIVEFAPGYRNYSR